jgi:hypothetical protein
MTPKNPYTKTHYNLNSSKKLMRKEHFQTHCMGPNGTLIVNPDKETTRKESYLPISLMQKSLRTAQHTKFNSKSK